MSRNYEKVKTYYERGLWDIKRVRSAVGKWITADEYQVITKEEQINGEEPLSDHVSIEV